MRRLLPIVVWSLTLCGCVLALATCIAMQRKAGAQAADEMQHLARARELRAGYNAFKEQLLVLRSDDPPGELLDRAHQALRAAGCDQAVLAGVTPQARQLLGNTSEGEAQTTRITVTLRDIRISQLGLWLASMQDGKPVWRPVSIDVSADQSGASGPLLQARIEYEATFVRRQ